MAGWKHLPEEIRDLIFRWLFDGTVIVARPRSLPERFRRRGLLSNYLTVGSGFVAPDMLMRCLRDRAEVMIQTPACMDSFLPLLSIKRLGLDLESLCKCPHQTSGDIWRPLWCPSLRVTVYVGADQVSSLQLPGLLTVSTITRAGYRISTPGTQRPDEEPQSLGLICTCHCPTFDVLCQKWRSGRNTITQTAHKLLTNLRGLRVETVVRWPARWIVDRGTERSESAVVSIRSTSVATTDCEARSRHSSRPMTCCPLRHKTAISSKDCSQLYHLMSFHRQYLDSISPGILHSGR